MLRILMLIHNHENRGSYFRALEIAKRFAAQGHFVAFAWTSERLLYRPAYGPAKPVVDREFPVSQNSGLLWVEMPCFTFVNTRQEGWSLFDCGWRIADALRQRWDLVYGFSHKPNCVLPALAAKARGARVVLDWADWWGGEEGLYQQCVIPSAGFQSLPRPLRWARQAVFGVEAALEGAVYRMADAVTLISEEFFQHPGAPRDLHGKSHIMHSGSDLEQIVPVERGAARQALRTTFASDDVVIGYVANFHMDETILIEAFAIASATNPCLRLLLAGAPLDRMTPELQQATSGRITHLGWLPFEQMENFLGAADLLALPLSNIALDRARYPHKLSDYVASGRPVVACDVGETGRLLRKYGFGRLSAPTSQGLATALVESAGDPAWRAEQEVGTRAAAEEFFNWDVLFEDLCRFLAKQTGLVL